MVEVTDLKDFIGIDYTDGMSERNLARSLATAKATVYGSVGPRDELDQYLPGDPRVDDLILAYGADIYLNRTLTGKEGAAHNRMIDQMETQVRLDLRLAKEGW